MGTSLTVAWAVPLPLPMGEPEMRGGSAATVDEDDGIVVVPAAEREVCSGRPSGNSGSETSSEAATVVFCVRRLRRNSSRFEAPESSMSRAVKLLNSKASSREQEEVGAGGGVGLGLGAFDDVAVEREQVFFALGGDLGLASAAARGGDQADGFERGGGAGGDFDGGHAHGTEAADGRR